MWAGEGVARLTQEELFPWLIGAGAALVLLIAFWAGRITARRRVRRALRKAQPWQIPTLEGWVRQGWLDPELIEVLPPQLSAGQVFYEWAWADPEIGKYWRLREPLDETTPFEAVVRDVWSNLPEAQKAGAKERLGAAVIAASTWWGGAERGWNGRPLAVPAGTVNKKQQGLPLRPMDDLTAAPSPGPLRGEPVAQEADGVDLVLALAALRRAQPRYTHPLAPKADSKSSLVQGLSTRVATDVGRQVGARVGASILGPIGAMVGQYLGEMAGSFGAKSLTQQSLPEPIAAAVKQTETALAHLGELVMSEDFARGARQPRERVLEIGKQVEVVREERSKRVRERIWPTPGQVLVEETLWVALDEMRGYKDAGEAFIQTARQANPSVAGAMILQNPWLVRSLPGGVDRLNQARQALNQAAIVIRRHRDSRQG